MYERAGYSPIERYNDNPYAQAWFEKDPARGHCGGRAAAYCSRVRKASWAGLVGQLDDRTELQPEPAHQRDRLVVARVRLGHDPPNGRVGEREGEQELDMTAAVKPRCTAAALGASMKCTPRSPGRTS